MDHAIIAKLRRELGEPIASERQVVYLLVEIRKLMEISGNGAGYKSLKFACDWIAHTILDRGEAQRIVDQIDKNQQLIEAMHNSAPGQILDTTSVKPTGEILSLSRVRNELSTFLRKFGLNSGLVDDDGKWAGFLTHYAAVVEDCPLRCIGKGLAYVDEVVLSIVQKVADPADQAALNYQLVIEWRWISKKTGIPTRSQQFY